MSLIDNDDWGDDGDEDFLATAAASVEESFVEDDADDALLAAAADTLEQVEVKQSADEDDYQALGLRPPSREVERCLGDEFGLTRFKPLQWRIVQSVMEDRRDQVSQEARRRDHGHF